MRDTCGVRRGPSELTPQRTRGGALLAPVCARGSMWRLTVCSQPHTPHTRWKALEQARPLARCSGGRQQAQARQEPEGPRCFQGPFRNSQRFRNLMRRIHASAPRNRESVPRTAALVATRRARRKRGAATRAWHDPTLPFGRTKPPSRLTPGHRWHLSKKRCKQKMRQLSWQYAALPPAPTSMRQK